MKKHILLSFSILIWACTTNSSSIITIDTHDDFNVSNFTDSLNYTMDTDTQLNLSLIHISEPTRPY